jgi:hypothetical protein
MAKIKTILAEWIHNDNWSRWMKYLFSISEDVIVIAENNTTGVMIHPKNVERWQKQMNTPYKELSDREKQSDVGQAKHLMKYLRSKGYEIRRKDE